MPTSLAERSLFQSQLPFSMSCDSIVVGMEPTSDWLKKDGNLLAPLVDIVEIYWFQVLSDPVLWQPSFWLFLGSALHSVDFLGNSRYLSSSLWRFQQKKCFFPCCPSRGLFVSDWFLLGHWLNSEPITGAKRTHCPDGMANRCPAPAFGTRNRIARMRTEHREETPRRRAKTTKNKQKYLLCTEPKNNW